MKFTVIVVGIVFYICLANGYTLHSRDAKHSECGEGEEECKDYCKIGEVLVLPGTSMVEEGRCRKLKCNEDFSYVVEGCGAAKKEGCTSLEHDFTKPFPDCCNQVCVNESSEAV